MPENRPLPKGELDSDFLTAAKGCGATGRFAALSEGAEAEAEAEAEAALGPASPASSFALRAVTAFNEIDEVSLGRMRATGLGRCELEGGSGRRRSGKVEIECETPGGGRNSGRSRVAEGRGATGKGVSAPKTSSGGAWEAGTLPAGAFGSRPSPGGGSESSSSGPSEPSRAAGIGVGTAAGISIFAVGVSEASGTGAFAELAASAVAAPDFEAASPGFASDAGGGLGVDFGESKGAGPRISSQAASLEIGGRRSSLWSSAPITSSLLRPARSD